MRSYTFIARLRSVFLAATLIVGISTSVGAQSGVSVDLPVLADGGYTDAQTGTSTGGNLLMPGTVAPKSSYFGSAVTITNPIPATAPTVTALPEPALSTADAVPAPEPAPAAPEPIVAETAPPAEPEITEAPALPPEPARAAPEPIVAETAPPAEPEITEAPALPPEPARAAPEPIVAETAPPAEPEITEAPALPPEPALSTADAVPPPEPEAVAASSDTATEIASATDTGTASATPGPAIMEPGRAMLVVFEGTGTNLSAHARGDLDGIAARVRANEDLGIQLMAYAGGNDLSSSKARRMSLSRALAVRSYFIEQDIRSTRIDVRALGGNDPREGDPINRVDVNITVR